MAEPFVRIKLNENYLLAQFVKTIPRHLLKPNEGSKSESYFRNLKGLKAGTLDLSFQHCLPVLQPRVGLC